MTEEMPKPDEIDDLMKAFGVKPPPAGGGAPATPGSPAPAALPFQNLSGGAPAGAPVATLDLLRDVSLHVRVEVGRARMYVQDILRLGSGSVVELDRLTGDPLDIYVNDCLVARGEVLVINENFAVRVTEVVQPVSAPEKSK